MSNSEKYTLSCSKLLEIPSVKQENPHSIYSKFRDIGEGSYGSVYYAENTVTGKCYALKKISFDQKNPSEFIDDAVKEIQVLSRLNHENCVGYIESYFTEDLDIYLVMEYCIGSAYDATKVLGQPLEEHIILEILRSTLNALCYIHSLSFIHRDIKGKNILISEDGVIKLADFGSTSLRSKTSSFIGSPYWMAPEVLLAMDEGEYDCKADIWSLGVTAIELAEMRPPHYQLNPMSAIYVITQEEPPAIKCESYSATFREYVSLLLVKDAKLRLSADALLDKLASFNTCSDNPTTLIKSLINKMQTIINKKFDNIQSQSPDTADDKDSESNRSRSSDIEMAEITNALETMLFDEKEEEEEEEETIEDDFKKALKKGSSIYTQTFNSHRGLLPTELKHVHLKELEYLDAPFECNLYRKCLDELLGLKNKEIFKTIQRLVRTQQKELEGLEERQLAQVGEFLKQSKLIFLSKMSHFDEEMLKLRNKHVSAFEEFLKKVVSVEREADKQVFKKNYSNINEMIKGMRIKSAGTKNKAETAQLSPIMSPNCENTPHSDCRTRNMDQVHLRTRQDMEAKFLQEELSLLHSQLLESHKTLIASHETLVSLQTSFMEEHHSLRLTQNKQKADTEVNKFLLFKAEYTKAFSRYHSLAKKNLPKQIKKRVMQMKKECNENIKSYKFNKKIDMKRLMLNNNDSALKTTKKMAIKMEILEEMKRMKEEGRRLQKEYARQELMRVICSVEKEAVEIEQRLTSNLNNFYDNQKVDLCRIKENMLQERLKLNAEFESRFVILKSKMESEIEKYKAYYYARVERLEKEHEQEWEMLGLAVKARPEGEALMPPVVQSHGKSLCDDHHFRCFEHSQGNVSLKKTEF